MASAKLDTSDRDGSYLNTAAFTPAAGMNLGLDHKSVPTQRLGDLVSLMGGGGHPTLGNGNLKFF